ncbi:hypothetical protein [Microbacterium petrolearium]
MFPLPLRRRPPGRGAYPVPWHIDRADPAHPIVRHRGRDPADAVRVFLCDEHGRARTERWGRVRPGEALQLCLCDVDRASAVTTLAWFDADAEYLWRFTV